MAEYDILVVGDINADLILRGDALPEFEQVEKMIDDATLGIGSSGVIFACGAARLGLKVAMTGKTGDDEFGAYMLRQMQQRGIDTSGVVVDPQIKTGLSVIFSRGNDRAILTYSGSIGKLRFDEIDMQRLRRARHLHLTSYFLLDELRPDVPRLFENARSAGLSISMDTNYDPQEKWDGGLSEALSRVDIFLPNETELHAISGVSDTELALKAMSEWIPTVAVKLGERGGLARQGSATAQADPLTISLVDTTGAGDSFDAGFLYGVLAGWSLKRSLSLACACGSLSTRAAGGTAAQPTLDEALQTLHDD